jgi:hypothetical protein
MTEREVMSVLNTLSKSSRRDEKRAKRRKNVDEQPAELMGAPEDADLDLSESQVASASYDRGDDGPPYGLPVPQNAVAKAKRRSLGAGLLSALMRPFARSSGKPSLGGRLFGMFASAKKSAPKTKARRRPPPQTTPDIPDIPQPLRGRASGPADPYAPSAPAGPRSAPPPRTPPVPSKAASSPYPPRNGAPASPQMMEATENAAPADLFQADTSQGRRRRV